MTTFSNSIQNTKNTKFKDHRENIGNQFKMDIRNVGGNLLKKVDLSQSGKQILGKDPYEYYIYQGLKDEVLSLSELSSFTVFFLSNSNDGKICIKNNDEYIQVGDAIQCEGETLNIQFLDGQGRILVAGTKDKHPEMQGIFVTKNKYIYKVKKPWGHELWFNERHPCYAFKEISINAGTKTSLQYHIEKRETNVLFEGEAKLHYLEDLSIELGDVTLADISTHKLEPISVIDVLPKIVHRLEASTNILLYEISTPHLDDVIRISDDSKRSDGLIEKEHSR